jgi:hypothetical protein
MSLIDSPSLASITGTHLDSACKHIQQCKVSFDHMLLFAESADELEKEKMRFCAHKDELIVGIGRPWKKAKTRTLPPCAYPKIVSNLGNINSKEDDRYQLPKKMITFLFHTAKDVTHRNYIIENMDNVKGFGHGERLFFGRDLPHNENFFFDGTHSDDGKDKCKDLSSFLDRMYDYYPVGICNTIAYANPRSGDTVGSVMIGGLRTVMNGHWEVHAGDLVQWYWTFEKDCFDEKGARKRYQTYDKQDRKIITDKFGMSPYEQIPDDADDDDGMGLAGEPAASSDGRAADGRGAADRRGGGQTKPPTAADKRRNFHDRQYGVKPQSVTPSEKAKSVARIKTYVKDDLCPRLYDTVRIFGRAIGTARPNELLDIQICRQSM